MHLWLHTNKNNHGITYSKITLNHCDQRNHYCVFTTSIFLTIHSSWHAVCRSFTASLVSCFQFIFHMWEYLRTKRLVIKHPVNNYISFKTQLELSNWVSSCFSCCSHLQLLCSPLWSPLHLGEQLHWQKELQVFPGIHLQHCCPVPVCVICCVRGLHAHCAYHWPVEDGIHWCHWTSASSGPQVSGAGV